MRIELYKCEKCKNYKIYFQLFKLNLKITTMNLPSCIEHSHKIIFKYVPKEKITKEQLEWLNKVNARISKRTNTNGETTYHTGLGQEVNTRDIDRICKEKGLVYGGEDLTREAAKNRAYNEAKINQQMYGGLREELFKGLS